MASAFLPGQREELGSGGKVIRGRRRLLPSFSPYGRSPSSAALIPHQGPEAHSGRSLRWFMGLISGVGKLFSSVIGSEDGSPSPSECFSNSDEYHDYSSNEHEDQLRSDDFTAFRMRASEVDRNVESLAIFPKSETKLVIEQLLMQETFTRDECDKLVEIIQSRVPDRNSVEIGVGTQNAVPIRVAEQGHSLSHNRNIYGISNFSPSIPSSFSPRFYAQDAVFPDLRNKAVLEAKKWFEEKKVSPSPTYDRSYGPCIFNTRMNQYGFEEDGSPIEMAKSYMQSLPPWRSPSFSANGLKTSPSHDNSTRNFGSHLLSTSEVKKRDYFAIGSYNTEENHRTSLNLLNNEQEFSKLGQSKLLSRFSVHEASTMPSVDAKTCIEVQDKCLKLQDGNASGAEQLMEADDGISVGAILQLKENVEVPFTTEEQIGSISAPQDSLVFTSTAERNNGDFFPETETLPFENIIFAEPSINKNSGDEVKLPVINSMQVDLDAGFNNSHPITDSELPDENPQTHSEANGSGENIETSSNFAEINIMKPDLESTSKGDPTVTSSSYGGAPAASLSEGTTIDPVSDISEGIRRTRAHAKGNKVQSISMKSEEPMQTQPPEPSRRTKRKSKAVKQKKWRG